MLINLVLMPNSPWELMVSGADESFKPYGRRGAEVASCRIGGSCEVNDVI